MTTEFEGENRALTLGVWHRSSRCVSGSCIEARQLTARSFEIRDTKQSGLGTEQPSITLPLQSFVSLFERLGGSTTLDDDPIVDVQLDAKGGATLLSLQSGVELRYDASEVKAFVASADEFVVSRV